LTYLREFKLSTLEPKGGQKNVAVGHRKSNPKEQIAKIIYSTSHKEQLSDGEVGEMWLSGPSVTAGYFNKPDLTEKRFHAKLHGSNTPFLHTRNMAFFEDDYLYICGCQKDLLIVNGVNDYPQDIEVRVQDHASPAVRPGCVAAFCFDDNGADGDLEVVFEIRNSSNHQAADGVNTVRTSVMNGIGIVPTRVVAIKERTILKTTSGKIQRRANSQALHNNDLNIIYEHDTLYEVGLEDSNYTRSLVHLTILGRAWTVIHGFCATSRCHCGFLCCHPRF